MLVLNRRIGEEILIGDNIRVGVVAIQGKKVRIGITAPRSIPVTRTELLPESSVGRGAGAADKNGKSPQIEDAAPQPAS
jgi:carbon storage regulator